VGSIDNDFVGTDMTIGADSALHRIIDAIDALSSTAASHQRTFVVEVMGRHCGYLALMSAIAGGCDYALFPENPPAQGWETEMCASLKAGREAGRRDSMVIVAEGAADQTGKPITAEYVRQTLQDQLGEDARVTILGHVQRGGTPSAYDRWASTWLGYEAARAVLGDGEQDSGVVFGFRENRIARLPLIESVANTQNVPTLIKAKNFERAMQARGGSFQENAALFAELATPAPAATPANPRRLGIIHAGGLAPGMNSAAQAAVRLGVNRGFVPLGVSGGFPGLRDGQVRELAWNDVEGWVSEGGAELGLRRHVPDEDELYEISRTIDENEIDALLILGGWNAYMAAHLLWRERDHFPALRIPMMCVPLSIDNNLPGSELAIGADTALNVIVEAIDRIKGSGAASQRAFVVETMGRNCGYLAMMSAIATGAERVYLPEEGITLAQLADDVKYLRLSFSAGRQLFLAIRSEGANAKYTTDFISRIFDEESQDLYDVRQNILGHIQQGGNPSPFDRLLATRLVSRAITAIQENLEAGEFPIQYLGLVNGHVEVTDIGQLRRQIDAKAGRPNAQWWLSLRQVNAAVNEPSF
jgi:6-phosphofructokinase 1